MKLFYQLHKDGEATDDIAAAAASTAAVARAALANAALYDLEAVASLSVIFFRMVKASRSRLYHLFQQDVTKTVKQQNISLIALITKLLRL